MCTGSWAVHQHSNLPGQLRPSEQRSAAGGRETRGRAPRGQVEKAHSSRDHKYASWPSSSLHEGDRMKRAKTQSSWPIVSKCPYSTQKSALFGSKTAGKFATCDSVGWPKHKGKRAHSSQLPDRKAHEITANRGLLLEKLLLARWNATMSKTASRSLENWQSRQFKLNC